MNECKSISEAEPIRQGDVFVSNTDGESSVPNVRVVLTADCDIAQNKAGPNLLVLPIVSAEHYALDYWLADKWDSLAVRVSDQLLGVVNRCHLEANQDASPFTKEFVIEWVGDAEASAIARAVRADPLKSEEIRRLCEGLRQLYAGPNVRKFEEALDAFLEIQVQTGIVRDRPKRKNQRSDIQNAIKSAKSDTFFLSSIPGFKSNGWIILLRMLETVGVHHLHKRRAPWFDDQEGYLRVGRLAPVYKYALSQQFGSLFSRIGLPDDYDKWKTMLVEEIAQTLYPEGAES